MKVHPKRLKWIIKQLSKIIGVIAMLMLLVAAVQFRKKSIVAKDGLTISIIENDYKNKFIGKQDVIEILFREFRHAIVGQPLELINIKEIEKVLEADIFIKNADVYIDALNRVYISVEQRVPIVRIIDDKEISYYLDDDGKRVRTSPKYTARVIVVTGKVGPYNDNFMKEPNCRLNKIFELIKFINNNPFWKAQFEQVHVDYKGEVSLIPKLGDHRVIFGIPNESIEEKFYQLEVFYQDGLPVEGWKKFKTINLAYKGQVVAEKR
ncbi:MAG: cell division protein FtsQ [Saprospiraceae bacterium]|nr:cell division protein FtsQ [Saprospiraceae bacterium]